MQNPTIIQGGMGVAVSGWPLARAVSVAGQLGVVSGTAIDTVLARRLQLGDIGGHVRRALDHFPLPEVAERIWEQYFVAGGKAPDAPFKSKPVPSLKPGRGYLELTIVSNFVEVFLAKQGHSGKVGVNLLQKLQLPTVPSLFGAMLAGVDYVLMGAGIPRHIPGVLDQLSQGEFTRMPVEVRGAAEEVNFEFDPAQFMASICKLKRPNFLAIVTTATLAQHLAKKSNGKVDGFVIEGSTAGGHNAPPRGPLNLDENGEPIYGVKDIPELEKFRELGLPFWLAGSYGNKEKLDEALAEGAQGVQIGTAFAYSNESGLEQALKSKVIQQVVNDNISVFTDPLCSPTGYPFKVVNVPGTLSEKEAYLVRDRICDLGYLREPYMTEDGRVSYRCASEPVEDYVRKGGEIQETVGRKCVCNGLLSAIGLPQIRKNGSEELPLITSGNDLVNLKQYLAPGATSYSAQDVIDCMLGVAQLQAV